MKIYTTGEVARMLNIPFYQLLYLEKTGKISPARKTGTDKRYYYYGDIEIIKERLKKIEKCRKSKKMSSFL